MRTHTPRENTYKISAILWSKSLGQNLFALTLSGLSPHTIKERRRENFSGGRRWRRRIGLCINEIQNHEIYFLILYLEQKPICVCVRVCALLFPAPLVFLVPSLVHRWETAACRACVHKPDLLLPGSSNSRLISLASCQSTAPPCSARSKFHLAGRARVNLSLPKHSIRHAAIIVRNTLCQGRKRHWGDGINIAASQSSIDYVIVKICHERFCMTFFGFLRDIVSSPLIKANPPK